MTTPIENLGKYLKENQNDLRRIGVFAGGMLFVSSRNVNEGFTYEQQRDALKQEVQVLYPEGTRIVAGNVGVKPETEEASFSYSRPGCAEYGCLLVPFSRLIDIACF